MADLVAVAESARNRYTSLAERAARIYSPLVHILSFSAFAFWLWKTGGDVRFAVNISAAVLIITCPCALGLAVPAVVTAASGKLFRKGVLIKNGTALERLAEVDVVVFDKTGTLTLGAICRPLPIPHPSPDLPPSTAWSGLREKKGQGFPAFFAGLCHRLLAFNAPSKQGSLPLPTPRGSYHPAPPRAAENGRKPPSPSCRIPLPTRGGPKRPRFSAWS